MTGDEKPFSWALTSALQAVARMKGNSAIVLTELLTEGERDDGLAPHDEPGPQQGWKPLGR